MIKRFLVIDNLSACNYNILPGDTSSLGLDVCAKEASFGSGYLVYVSFFSGVGCLAELLLCHHARTDGFLQFN